MALDLKKRRTATKPLAIDVDGDVLNLRYKTAQFTPSALAALTDAQNEAAKTAVGQAKDQTEKEGGDAEDIAALKRLTDILTETLIDTVTEWDLTNGGELILLTQEDLVNNDVDFELIAFILNAIKEAQNPNPTKSKPSETP